MNVIKQQKYIYACIYQLTNKKNKLVFGNYIKDS